MRVADETGARGRQALMMREKPGAGFRLDAAVIGAQKAATTTIFERLARHPAVSGCVPKEPHHFGRTDWAEAMEVYAAMFPPAASRTDHLTLEASTTYTFVARCADTASRLHSHNPDMKLIFVMRDPVDRIVSAHRHAVDRGYDISPDLETAVARAPALVGNTRYASCLRPYRARFGSAQILILTFEDVTHDQDATIARILGFLGLRPHADTVTAANAASAPKLHHHHDGNRAMEALARRAPGLYRRFFASRATAVSTLRPETEAGIRRDLDGEMAEVAGWAGRDLAAWRA